MINVNENDKRILAELARSGLPKAKRIYNTFKVLLLRDDFKEFVVIARKMLTLATEEKRDQGLVSRMISLYITENRLTEEVKISGLYAMDLFSHCLAAYITKDNIPLEGISMGTIYFYDDDYDVEPEFICYFPVTLSIEEMQQFIQDNSAFIREIQGQGPGSKLRDRVAISKKLIRNLDIFNIYQEVKQITPSKRGTVGGYIDASVKKRLKGEGINMVEGTIRSIVGSLSLEKQKVNRNQIDVKEIIQMAEESLREEENSRQQYSQNKGMPKF
jgi:hypothetical protein